MSAPESVPSSPRSPLLSSEAQERRVDQSPQLTRLESLWLAETRAEQGCSTHSPQTSSPATSIRASLAKPSSRGPLKALTSQLFRTQIKQMCKAGNWPAGYMPFKLFL